MHLDLTEADAERRSRLLLHDGGFMDWYGRSDVRDSDGQPMAVYHGTDRDFDELDPSFCGGGIHFGSLGQARQRLFGIGERMRRDGVRIIPAYLRLERMKRMNEQDSWGENQILKVRDAGYDGIVYLNRREGLTEERFAALKDGGWIVGFGWPKIQALSDRKFLELVPEARDSYIVFDVRNIKLADETSAWRAELQAPAFRR